MSLDVFINNSTVNNAIGKGFVESSVRLFVSQKSPTESFFTN